MRTSRLAPLVSILPAWLQAPILPHFVAKELHVLLAPALFGALLVGLGTLWEIAESGVMTMLFCYVIASAVVGAIASGHDLVYRTLSVTLSMPFPRQSMWNIRLLLSFLAMLPASLVPLVTLPFSMPNDLNLWERIPLIFFLWCGPLLNGLFATPWLTLLSRSALFGVVFAAGIPFVFLTIIQILPALPFGQAYYDFFTQPIVIINLLESILLIYWITVGILGWRKFIHLEVLEKQALPSFWQTRARQNTRAIPIPVRKHPVWQLLKKELMLQRMTFVLVALILIVTCGFLIAHRFRPDIYSGYLGLWACLCAPLAAVLIGSVASADERQFGTADWQILLPISFWKQWTIKALVVFLLAALFAGLLPAVLIQLTGRAEEFGPWDWTFRAIMLAQIAMFLAGGSLYVSSLCNSGLKAMLASLPFCLAELIISAELIAAYIRFRDHTGKDFGQAKDLEWLPWWQSFPLVSVLLFMGFLVLLSWFAMINHRSQDRSFKSVCKQITVLFAAFLIVFISATLSAVF